MGEIYVGDFYSPCKTKRLVRDLVKDENRVTALSSVLKMLCQMLKDGCLDWAKIESALRGSYQKSFFAYPWQKDIQVQDDLSRLKRFAGWLGDVEVVECNRDIRLDTGKNILHSRVNLVFIGHDKAPGAVVIRLGAADKSPGGRSVHTSTKTDLYAMAAKGTFEKQYPGVSVSLVYLANDSDSLGDIGGFVVSGTRKSNVFTNRFDEFYKDGNWQEPSFMQAVDDVISKPVSAGCFGCFQKGLCATETIQNMNRMEKPDKDMDGYCLPSFTAVQQKVVEHVEGPMLVVAGPGSGKTATLIGRGVSLIRKGVEPEFILAITFTNKAAEELSGRFKSVCGGEAPVCSTIHSLALEILRQNREICGNAEVLSGSEKMELLAKLTDELVAPIPGFKYGIGEEGRIHFLTTLCSRVEACLSGRKQFEEENPDIGASFYDVVDEYDRIVRARGYVTFDQMVPLCNELFISHPEILEARSSVHKFIMVDEFQDIDADQAQFIYALASHRNLVVVGDDDQTIYEFRGGSNRYMLEFRKKFPEAEAIVLGTNFRSGQEIVDASQNLIKGNKNRIQKDLSAAREKGMAPMVIEGQTAEDLERIVRSLTGSGVSLDDIAVLGSKNKTLEDLSQGVSFPVVLGKALLVENALFMLCLDVLSMFYEGVDDARLLHYLLVSGCDLNVFRRKDGIRNALIEAGYLSDDCRSVKKGRDDLVSGALSLLFRLFGILETGPAAFFFIDSVVAEFHMEDSVVAEAIEEVVTKRHIRTTKALFEAFKYMSVFSDETRLMPDRRGSVLFITSHESKGMEFPVVIMVDDYKTDGSESTSRLYYVAMTRAKDRLIVMKSPGKSTLLDKICA